MWKTVGMNKALSPIHTHIPPWRRNEQSVALTVSAVGQRDTPQSLHVKTATNDRECSKLQQGNWGKQNECADFLKHWDQSRHDTLKFLNKDKRYIFYFSTSSKNNIHNDTHISLAIHSFSQSLSEPVQTKLTEAVETKITNADLTCKSNELFSTFIAFYLLLNSTLWMYM